MQDHTQAAQQQAAAIQGIVSSLNRILMRFLRQAIKQAFIWFGPWIALGFLVVIIFFVIFGVTFEGNYTGFNQSKASVAKMTRQYKGAAKEAAPSLPATASAASILPYETPWQVFAALDHVVADYPTLRSLNETQTLRPRITWETVTRVVTTTKTVQARAGAGLPGNLNSLPGTVEGTGAGSLQGKTKTITIRKVVRVEVPRTILAWNGLWTFTYKGTTVAGVTWARNWSLLAKAIKDVGLKGNRTQNLMLVVEDADSYMGEPAAFASLTTQEVLGSVQGVGLTGGITSTHGGLAFVPTTVPMGNPVAVAQSLVQQYGPFIQSAATANKVDPAFVVSIMMAEDPAGDPSIQSSAGAVGLMQIEPGGLPACLGQPGANLTDPQTNISLGTKFLSELLAGFGGSYAYAAAGYNGGPGSVQEFDGVPPASFASGQTFDYVNEVLAYLPVVRQALGESGEPSILTTGSIPGRWSYCA